MRGGWNRVDSKLLVTDAKGKHYPVLIEYKWHQDKLEKLDEWWNIENKNKNGEISRNVKQYAVNGAVHYANAILHYTNYDKIIAIWVTWYIDGLGELKYSIWVYLVSKDNFWIWQKVGEYIDLSFLKKENFDNFVSEMEQLNFDDAKKEFIKKQKEEEIKTHLSEINNHIFENEYGVSEKERLFLVVATIIATLWIENIIPPLNKDELFSSTEKENNDGSIMMRKIKGFLKAKELPEEKEKLILNNFENILLKESLNEVVNGESQLKRIFTKIFDDIGIYYKINLTTDFTGLLFNEMYKWLWYSEDKNNDVVLTPSYVGTLLAKLARVNKDSYVWDIATGSAWLLVAAMNEMLIDAKNNIPSPDKLKEKEKHIKEEQILGVELMSEIYMLAVLNMIIMWDGSSNILNTDSLKKFDWKYAYWENKDKSFPADAFILNPPYSVEWNGMIFVQKGLDMMEKGHAAIIIQSSSWSWRAVEFNKHILRKHTLEASIKMPSDLFVGKAGVNTHIYVFKVNEKHDKKSIVKFIDFSNDWYKRSGRAKSSKTLIDADNAKGRYEELVNLVKYGKKELNLFTEKEYYEWTIDPENGADWNQLRPIDTRPSLEDFKKTVSDYIIWEVNTLLKDDSEDKGLGKNLAPFKKMLEQTEWGKFKLDELFEVLPSKKMLHANKIENIYSNQVEGSFPYVVRTERNNGLRWYIKEDIKYLNDSNTLSFAQDTFLVFYQSQQYFTWNNVKILKPKFDWITKDLMLYIASSLQKSLEGLSWWTGSTKESIKEFNIMLPLKNWKIDFDFMDIFIKSAKQKYSQELINYLSRGGYVTLSDFALSNDELKALKDFEEWKWIWVKKQLKDLFNITWTRGLDEWKLELKK